MSGGRWEFSYSLPPWYKDYDLYSGYKVVVNETDAYLHYNMHRERYAGFRRNHSQLIIRNSNEPKYFVVKGQPKYHDRDRDRNSDRDRRDHDRDRDHH